jgi:hypothetical protein
MGKFKIAGINNGVPTDRGIASGNGGVGGLTSLSGLQVQPAVKIGSNAAATGSIIAQKGRKEFRVTDGTNTGNCMLVNKASGSLAANEMSITVTDSTSATFYASRITNKFVWDFNNVRYRWKTSAATATFVQVANA